MSLKRNVVVNYIGQGWVALMGIAFVPIYIKYLNRGLWLDRLFVVLQMWLTLLDMGMTPTLHREVARYSAGAHSVCFRNGWPHAGSMRKNYQPLKLLRP